MLVAECCQILEWDSDFFQRRIARLAARRLDVATWRAAEHFCRQERVECLYFLCDSGDQTSVRCAEHAGLNFVDIRLTLDRPLGDFFGNGHGRDADVRRACPEDIPALRAIAGVSHRDGRFHADGHFPSDRCDELYRTWIAKSCTGYADAVWVAGPSRHPLGYITCHVDNPHLGRIGLFAVAGEAQGQGLGQRLGQAAIRWLADQGATRVTVVTQGRNIQAQRAYQRIGFRTCQVELWFQRWFTPAQDTQ